MWQTLSQIFNAQLIAEAFGAGGTLLILAGLGYLFTDRAGVFNIAIEGLLLFSAFFAAVGSGWLNNSYFGPWFGLVCGVLASLVVSAVFFVISIKLRADIIVVGIGVNLLASAGTVFLLQHLFGNQGLYQPPGLPTLPSFSIPGLSALPLLGPTFTGENILTYLAWLLVPMAWVVLYRTRLGLRIRSVGENPEAAASVGIDVQRVQLTAIMICGLLTGLAGAYLSIGPFGGFNRDMSAGQGWIALAAETLGNGTPLGTFVSSVFFAAAQGVASNMQAAGIGAAQLAHAIPYVVTVIGLAIASRRAVLQRLGRRRGRPPSPEPLAASANADTVPAAGA
ncbi:MAG TPA: ABC transporter permease [Chloroflexota bacterium]|nr:ABC transporter permease [Chloroflexota bacterium]